MANGSSAAKVFVYAFSAIFSMIGLGLLYAAFGVFQDGDATKGLLTLFAGLAFGGVGVAVYLLTRAGFRAQAREEDLRAAYPNEPWKWREDWANGRMKSSTKGVARFLWGFAILWNLISTPMILVLLPEEVIEKQNYGALFGLIFPLVGIGLLVAATRKTIQERKFGDCAFVMQRTPGVLGGDLAGTIVIPRGMATAETLSVRLSCIHAVTHRSGKSTTTDEHVLWQAEEPALHLAPAAEESALGAAVRFTIPYDSRPTETIDGNSRIFWKLEASADVPGVDFAAVFEVPVFKTGDSSPGKTEEELRSEELRNQPPILSPVDLSAVSINATAGGGTEFVIHPAGKMPGMAGAVVFALIFGGVGIGIGYLGAPILFPLVFVGFALLIIFLMIFTAFGESRIVVEEGHVSVRNMLFGIMRGKRMPCSSIAKIGVTGEGRPGKPGHFSITFTKTDGKTASPLQFMSERGQADWLAEELRKVMEPWRKEQGSAARAPKSEMVN